MPTTTVTLTFRQQLLVMEALDRLADSVRTMVSAGDYALQGTLDQIEHVQALISSASTVETTRTVA